MAFYIHMIYYFVHLVGTGMYCRYREKGHQCLAPTSWPLGFFRYQRINWSTDQPIHERQGSTDQPIVSTWYNVIQYNMIYDLIWYNIMWYDMIWYVKIHCPKRVLGFLLMTGAELVLLGRGDYEITPCCVSRHHSLDDGLMGEKPFNMIWRLKELVVGERWFHESAESGEDRPLHEYLEQCRGGNLGNEMESFRLPENKSLGCLKTDRNWWDHRWFGSFQTW